MSRRKVLLLAGVLLLFGKAAHAADPDALWKIVHDRCVPNQIAHADPIPCTQVHLEAASGGGYAVLKDLNGLAQFLLIPTTRLTGIDDPAVLESGAPNFFDAAWQARDFVERVLQGRLPSDATALVINSVRGRTQSQFHIHVDCLRRDVRDRLRAHADEIGPTWAELAVPLAGRRYMAMRVPGQVLGPHDPIKLLATGIPGAAGEMGQHTLVVVGPGADGAPYFTLLDRKVTDEGGDRGNGTELLDRACTLAAPL